MSSTQSSSLMVFLFTDLVDSTGWKQALGDVEYAQGVLQPHNELFRTLLSGFPDAQERNFTGDGFLATFAAPSAAIQFALRLHDALQKYAWSEAVRRNGRQPETRIGIHLGEAIAYADADPKIQQITGQAVDLAARIIGLASGKQTLLTRHAFDSARQYVRDASLSWPAHGQYRCKGSDDPLQVYEVGVPGMAPLTPPPDSEKAKRVKVDADDDTGSWRPAAGLPIPRRDGWTIDKKIGEGGFGEVWLAQHKRTKEHRVFKFCFDAERLRSFKRELTFFRLIQSELGDRPDIAKLHEVHVDTSPYFLESEYVEAGNLGQWVKAQGGLDKVPLETRLRMMAQIARAVAAAHSLGIIHKDLKPSNILITVKQNGEPQPQLADFGIGILSDRTLLQKGAITETGFTESVMFGNDSSRTGTRLYSPPEANLGKPATTGFDIYALGVMLFQMMVGDLQRALGTGWQEAVSSDSALDPIQATLLADDITAATHAEPVQRLPSAATFAERLESLEARREKRLAAFKREAEARIAAEWQRRVKRLRWAMAGSVAVIAVVATLGVYAWQAKNQSDVAVLEAKKQEGIAQENAATAAKQTGIAKDRAEEALKQETIAEANAFEARRQATVAKEQTVKALKQEEIANGNAKESRRLLDLSRLRTAQADFANNSVELARHTQSDRPRKPVPRLALPQPPVCRRPDHVLRAHAIRNERGFKRGRQPSGDRLIGQYRAAVGCPQRPEPAGIQRAHWLGDERGLEPRRQPTDHGLSRQNCTAVGCPQRPEPSGIQGAYWIGEERGLECRRQPSGDRLLGQYRAAMGCPQRHEPSGIQDA